MISQVAAVAVFAAAKATKAAQGSGVPNPGQGQAPPGADKFLTILQWVAWVGYGVCVLGVIVAAATLAIQHRHGTGGENGSRLGWVLAGALLIGSASALVQGLA